MGLLKKRAVKKILRVLKNNRRYYDISKLGEGGLANVTRTFDGFLNRIVAVKKLKMKRALNPDYVKMFLNEAKLLGYLQHHGITPVFDLSLNKDGIPSYSMKCLEGKSLDQFINEQQAKNEMSLPIPEYLEIFTKVCETLAFAHDKGVIHLDLKPGNIMIGDYGEVMVMDWGNARLFDKKNYENYLRLYADKTDITTISEDMSDDMIIGTPMYMSPEQTLLPREQLTPESDIFSAGIMLYETLTGIHPFPEYDPQNVMKLIRNYSPPPIHSINPDIPLRLSDICIKMLEKQKSARYSSFHEILYDLISLKDSGESFKTKAYGAGDIICKEGEQGNYAFSILTGRVCIIKSVEGIEKVMANLGKGEIVGELSIFTNEPRSATVKTLEPTSIRIMSKKEVECELEKLHPWVGSMITLLSKRFIDINNKLASR